MNEAGDDHSPAQFSMTRLCDRSVKVPEKTQTEIEAATFRRLIQHLQEHTEVQNIDLMILADFCRNCLAKWYAAAAKERGHDVQYAEAQELIYGMPYPDWKSNYQKEATPEQLRAVEEILRKKAEQEKSV